MNHPPKTAYILTNGFLDYGHNYVKMFSNTVQANKYAKYMGINIKQHLYEINLTSTPINIIIRQNTSGITINIIENYNAYMDTVIPYYKSLHTINNSETLKIKTSMFFQNDKTIFQMFNNEHDSFSYVSNINYESENRK
jgi:hypothetical protein